MLSALDRRRRDRRRGRRRARTTPGAATRARRSRRDASGLVHGVVVELDPGPWPRRRWPALDTLRSGRVRRGSRYGRDGGHRRHHLRLDGAARRVRRSWPDGRWPVALKSRAGPADENPMGLEGIAAVEARIPRDPAALHRARTRPRRRQRRRQRRAPPPRAARSIPRRCSRRHAGRTRGNSSTRRSRRRASRTSTPAHTSPDDPNPPAFDCSELTKWAAAASA